MMRTLKLKMCFRGNIHLLKFGISNSQQLLSNDGKNLDVDAVEFVETRPSTGLSQTREETTHHLVVETLTKTFMIFQTLTFSNLLGTNQLRRLGTPLFMLFNYSTDL